MASNTTPRISAPPHPDSGNYDNIDAVVARSKRPAVTRAHRKAVDDEQQATEVGAQAGDDAILVAAGAAPVDATTSLPTQSSATGAGASTAAGTAAAATAASGGIGGIGTVGLLASTIALVAVAAGSGGSHTSTPVAQAPVAPAAVDSSVNIKVLAGPLIAPVLIEVFDKNGNLVAGGLSDLTGAGHLLFPLGFSGAMLVKVSATTGDGIAYVDEATGTVVHYTGSLRAMVMFADGGQATVTPLSELAVVKMGLTGDNANVDEATVTRINALVAKLFGIHALTGPAVHVLDAAFDASDGVSDAERFGEILAGLSGADSTTGGLAATIARLAAAIDIVTGTMGNAGSSLLAIGNAAFAAGPNAAKAAAVTGSFAAVPHIALTDGEDSYLNATEDGIRGVLHYSQMSAGDVVQLHTGEGATASNLGAAHTVTAPEAASGFISVTLTRADLPVEGSFAISATHTDAFERSTISNTVSILADYTAPALALTYADGTQLHGMGVNEDSTALKVWSENLATGDVLHILLAGSAIGAGYAVQARDVSNGFALLDIARADLGVDGDKVIRVTATDAAGNAGTSNAVALALDTSVPDTPVDTTPPAGLSMALAADTGRSETDGVTSIGAITVSGMEAAAGTVWRYSVDSGDTWATGSGSGSFELAEGSYTIGQVQVMQIDAAHNAGPVSSNGQAFVIDTTAPTAPVMAFGTESSLEHPYADGATVVIQARFNETVYVDGQPMVHLAVDPVDTSLSDALYTSGSGSHLLRFAYTVQSDDLDSNGVDIVAGSLNPNADSSITIRDLAGNDAYVTYAARAGVSLQTVGPEPVVVPPDTTPPDTPTIAMQADTGVSPHDNLTNQGTMIVGGLEALSGTTWHYSYDYGNNYLTGSSSGSFELTEGNYDVGQVRVYQSDAAHNDSAVATNTAAFTIDTTAPVVIGTSFFTSGPNFTNDNIIAQVSFNEVLYVTGTPTIHYGLDSHDGALVVNPYTANPNFNGTLYFSYRVGSGDEDLDGVDILAGNLNPGADPGVSITDLAGNEANTLHPGVIGGAGGISDQRVLTG